MNIYVKIIIFIFIILSAFIIGYTIGQTEEYAAGQKDGGYTVLQKYMVQLCCCQKISNDDKKLIQKYYEKFWKEIEDDKFFKKR